MPKWEKQRAALLTKLIDEGHVCASHAARCAAAVPSALPSSLLSKSSAPSRSYAEACATLAAPTLDAAISLRGAPWIDPAWLLARENCEQRRLAHLFASGLAWIDHGVGTLISQLHPLHSLVVLTSDHGASFLGKGSPYEAGIRVPLLLRWRAAPFATGTRFAASVTHLDLLPTLLHAASPASTLAPSMPSSTFATVPALSQAVITSTSVVGHGASLLPALRIDASASAAAAAAALDRRPIVIEVGFARAVRLSGFKLVVVNDPHRRCVPSGSDGSGRNGCRNFHGQRIDLQPALSPLAAVSSLNATRDGGGGGGIGGGGSLKRFGLGNMTYDAAARHPAFCATRQLYDLRSDPLEQHNLVTEQPGKYAELLHVLESHVHVVEAANPAVARQMANRAGGGRGSIGFGCAR